MAPRLRTILLIGIAATMLPAVYAHAAEEAPDRATSLAKSCAAPGAWIDAASGDTIASETIFRDLASQPTYFSETPISAWKPVVLLGEHHDSAEHHRWQLYAVAAMHGRGIELVLGLEMFPRRVQPVLDQWVRGELSKKAFLAATNWRQVWGFDPELYMPLFDFARMNGVPMVALNVERGLVSRVAAKGWADVPKDEREGLTDPAAASPEYQRSLAAVFAMKQAMKAAPPDAGAGTGDAANLPDPPKPDEAKLAAIIANPEFQHFTEAQLTWDRAMAEGLAAAKRQHPGAVIVGIMGSGHIEHAYGVPHQLRDLGITDSVVLIPVETGETCSKTEADIANALFTVKTPQAAADERPKLGVMIATKENAALVNAVMPDSVAAAANVQKGDFIIRAAGLDIHGAGELIEVVSRQAPGTWLPLTVKRDGAEIELIAKFAPPPQERKP